MSVLWNQWAECRRPSQSLCIEPTQEALRELIPPAEPQGSGVAVASPGPRGVTRRVFLLASRGPPAIPLLMPCQLGVGQGGMYLVHASPGDSIQ